MSKPAYFSRRFSVSSATPEVANAKPARPPFEAGGLAALEATNMNLIETIKRFPSLSAALALVAPAPESVTDLVLWLNSQETGDGGRGRKAAARFVLSWWFGSPFNLRQAWQSWDDAHRKAAIGLLSDTRDDAEFEDNVSGDDGLAMTTR